MKTANPDNDEFSCEVCGEIGDIEDSVKLKDGRLICINCSEKNPE